MSDQQNASPDQAFINHIQSHLNPGEEVICKICGKTAHDIIKEAEPLQPVKTNWCAFCGETMDKPTIKKIHQHIFQCERHPLSKAVFATELLRAALTKAVNIICQPIPAINPGPRMSTAFQTQVHNALKAAENGQLFLSNQPVSQKFPAFVELTDDEGQDDNLLISKLKDTIRFLQEELAHANSRAYGPERIVPLEEAKEAYAASLERNPEEAYAKSFESNPVPDELANLCLTCEGTRHNCRKHEKLKSVSKCIFYCHHQLNTRPFSQPPED